MTVPARASCNDTASPAPLARRTLFTLGAASLLAGCAATATPKPAAAPSPTAGGTSPLPDASPSPSTPPSWRPPAPNKPLPGVCPSNADVLHKPGNPLQYLPCNGTDIALTIDDGPHPTWTPKVLALLARHRIHATFCMIGQNAAAHPDLVAAVLDGGHHIANHTYTHPMNLPALTAAQIRAEIGRTSDAITAAGGSHPRLFRAPGGTWSTAIVAACTAAGMRPLDWSVDTRDWSLPGVAHIVQTILTRTHPGAIILDHDGGGNRQQTVDALTIALPRLIDAGYHFTQP